MTAKEKKVYSRWNRLMTVQGFDGERIYWNALQTLYEESFGKEAPCSIDMVFERLMLRDDKTTRQKAMKLYGCYHVATGKREALEKLASDLVNLCQQKI